MGDSLEFILNLGRFAKAKMLRFSYIERLGLQFFADSTAEVYFKKTGEKLSLTVYVVKCLGSVLKDHPQLNSFKISHKTVQIEGAFVSSEIFRNRLLFIYRRLSAKNLKILRSAF